MIKEIIELLSNDDKSLCTPLLKSQVFAKRIGNDILYNWVVRELNGYDPHGEMPNYRYAKVSPYATLTTDDYQGDQLLPLSVFDDNIIQGILKFKIDNGVKAIEEIASGKNGNTIIKPFGADFDAMLTREARKNGASFHISNARLIISTSEFTNVAGKIRSKLLELVLEIESEFPNIDEELNNKINKEKVSNSITNIMTHINITSNGQGNVITTGNNNKVEAVINISKGDLDALRSELERNKINTDDIDELTTIIKSEQPVDNDFGVGVKGWMSKMLDKAVNGSWEIGVATAGGLLVEVLKKFYGF